MAEYNIYCDESCHLENDGQTAMVLGGIWCEKKKYRDISNAIKGIKERHNIPNNQEFKWHKVSSTKLGFYVDLVNFFFDDEHLNFRVLAIPEKHELDHDRFKHNHDDFYYKIYFDMLKIVISPNNNYNVYLDIKDTQGYNKVEKLRDVIQNSNYDFSKTTILKIQEVRSHEVLILQLADVLIGAVGYFHRGLDTSESKMALVDLIKARSGYDLNRSTLPSEKKFNLFNWKTGFGRNKV